MCKIYVFVPGLLDSTYSMNTHTRMTIICCGSYSKTIFFRLSNLPCQPPSRKCVWHDLGFGGSVQVLDCLGIITNRTLPFPSDTARSTFPSVFFPIVSGEVQMFIKFMIHSTKLFGNVFLFMFFRLKLFHTKFK